jgi:hypothetical protein
MLFDLNFSVQCKLWNPAICISLYFNLWCHKLFSFRLQMNFPHSVFLAYNRGFICAWYCICTDCIQLTYFWILSKTISSRIFFFFTFCLEVYHELFLFLLLVLLFLVILGIISHIFALFFCHILIIPRHYPKFTLLRTFLIYLRL